MSDKKSSRNSSPTICNPRPSGSPKAHNPFDFIATDLLCKNNCRLVDLPAMASRHLRLLCACLVLSTAIVYVAADAKTSAAVKAEINALIKHKNDKKYSDFSTFLSYLQIGMSKASKADLTPLAMTTMFIPSNKAIAKIPSKVRTNVAVLQKIVPFHICAKKYTFNQIAKGKFKTCPTPVAPPLANTSYNVAIFRIPPKVQLGPAATTPAADRATVMTTATTLYVGKYFNAIGVDRVMKPPGVKW